MNFTLAVALVTVIVIQIFGFQSHKFSYFSKFINLKVFWSMVKNVFKKQDQNLENNEKKSKPSFFQGILNLFVGLLELVSEIAKVISFSFRLFGNMFAGMVLTMFLSYMVPVGLGSFILLYELFIGALQAFVFCMLAAVFMNIAVQAE